jgi:hypothetical protein
MRHARLLSVAALLCLGNAAPASAQDAVLIDGSQAQAILDVALGYGSASLETQDNGNPRIAGHVAGLPYQVFFMNCAEGSRCEDLNFYAGFSGTKPTLDAINAWNRDKRFGNAYLDSELDAVIEYDLNLDHGVTRDNLDADFSVWSQLLDQFAAYVGYK